MNQGTEQWLQDRLGHVTASRAADILANGKGGAPSATRQTYVEQLVAELMTGQPQGFGGNEATEWGHRWEPVARQAFEEESGLMVIESGFIRLGELLIGCSPDGLIGTDAGLEIKCPMNPARHLRCFVNDSMPAEHMPQVQFSMYVTGRKRWHFVSYHPNIIDPTLRLFTTVIERDEEMIQRIAERAIETCAMVDAMVAGITLSRRTLESLIAESEESSNE